MFYDFFGESYKKGGMTRLGALNLRLYHRRVCRTMFMLQGPEALVLEIGPGMGWFAAECTARNQSYVGIECNRGLLRALASKYRMICAFVPPLPIKSGICDVIVADQVVEHMPTFREALTLLAECHRGLKPEGLLVLGFPDYSRMTGLAFYDWDYSHAFLTTKNRMCQILGDVGFEPLEIVQFTGSIWNCLSRTCLDLLMVGLSARPIRLIAEALRGGGVLYRMRKSFNASTVIFARKRAVVGEK